MTDYIIQVKRNQPTLFQSIVTAFDSQTHLSSDVHKEYSRGRHETRTAHILKATEDMKNVLKCLERVIHVERRFVRKWKETQL